MDAQEILKTKAELIAIQYMVANLYASMFGERFGENALPAAQQFSKSLKEHIGTWTIPGMDAAIADHMTGEMQEAIDFNLALMEDLVKGKVEMYKSMQAASKAPKN
jgi:hypothetical protein